jgi:hypothetical protein
MGDQLQGEKGMFVINLSSFQSGGDFAPPSSAPARMDLYHSGEHHGYSLSSIVQIADGKVLHVRRFQGIMKRI